jgi:hypothetical protein
MMEREKSHIGEAITSTARAVQKEITGSGGEHPTSGTVDQGLLEAIFSTWEEKPKQVAMQMVEQYGLPNEATASRLIWYNSGPWKRTIVYRDEIPHNFPKPHTDLLEQFIDYQVPLDKFNDMAAFDGSVIPERTKGEISARCDMEAMNFLALNLAHDVVTGRRTVKEAREFYAKTAMNFMMGEADPYTKGLQFPVPQGGTTDLDETMIMKAVMGSARERLRKDR